jgi:hypothetical protein
MIRVFISTVLGVLLGIGIGLGIGWGLPQDYTESTIAELAPTYQEQYTLMIAAAYVNERDVNGALERLRVLGVENIPAYVQDLSERYISSSRNVDDIRLLVALSEGFGRLTAPMQSFCQLCTGGGQ